VWLLFLVRSSLFSFCAIGGSFNEVLLSLVQSRSQREFLQDVIGT